MRKLNPNYVNRQDNIYYPLLVEEKQEIYIYKYKDINFYKYQFGGYIFYLFNKIRLGFINNPYKAKYNKVEEIVTL